jgi:hypothetical protein
VTVGGLAISPEAGRVAVDEAGERPYGQTVVHLRRHHGIGVSKDLLERLTGMVGQFWLERDDELTRLSLRDKIIPLGEMDCDCCCVFADGTMIHTDGDWHEVRVGTVSSRVGGAAPKSSMARFGDVERFGSNLWRKACEYGYRGALLKAFLGDGSHWIWNIADMHFADAVRILDWYHLAEHIGKCAEGVFGEGTQESKQWAAGLRQIMREGKVGQALHEVEKLPGRSQNIRQAKHELITYLINNRDRVNYPYYRCLGLPIGSGEVEADCKVLVQARCKSRPKAGRWTRDAAEQILRVRCAQRDASFDRLWDNTRALIAVWQKRRLREQRQMAA